MTLSITCDRARSLVRAAVWDGKQLRDLFVDSLERPDFSGTLVGGRVTRILSGQGAGWAEAGLPQKIYFENGQGLQAGDRVALRVQSTLTRGKGWIGHVEKKDDALKPGLIAPPPTVWEKALEAAGAKAAIRFNAREDYEAFLKSGAAKASLDKEPVHPDLDERIAALLDPFVPLPGGGSLVIEPTEALTAIDVNAGEKGNPTSVNLSAAGEIARQIRLRQIGGLIVVDALKMSARADRSKMLNALNRACASDPAGVRVFDMTKLGLVEMTRTRRGPSLAETMRGAPA